MNASSSHVVKIECNGIGSGFVYYPENNPSKAYIITARHCVLGEDQTSEAILSDIIITFVNVCESAEESYRLSEGDVLLCGNDNDKEDIAIIIVENGKLPSFIEKANSIKPIAFNGEEKDCVINGYPTAADNRFKRTLQCEFVDDNDYKHHFQLSVEDKIINEYSANDLLTGYSGCGIFQNIDSMIYAWGIVFGYDQYFKRLRCIHLELVNEILRTNNYSEITLIKLKTAKDIRTENILHDFASISQDLTAWHSFIDKGCKIHIPRKEIKNAFDWALKDSFPKADNPKTHPLLVLSGDAGLGKTVILKGVCQKLTDHKIPVLALKADIRYGASIKELNEILDVGESLIGAIKFLSNSGKVVVIIDQLDAISQSVFVDRRHIDTYNTLVKKLIEIPNVKVILSVRSFDLEHDYNLRLWKDYESEKLTCLEDNSVNEVLNALSIPTNLPNELKTILTNPHHLSVFGNIYNDSLNVNGLLGVQDLYGELWKQKVIDTPVKISSIKCKRLLYGIADELDIGTGNVIDIVKWEDFQQEINYLQSEGLLVIRKNEIQFFHQAFYEYCHARHFVESQKSLKEYLISNQQVLHLRSSIKHILSYLRTYKYDEYLKTLNGLLLGRNVKFHIKLLVINMIGSLKTPNEKEMSLVKRVILNDNLLTSCFIESVFTDSWNQFLSKEGTFDRLLGVKKKLRKRTLKDFCFKPKIKPKDKEEMINQFYELSRRTLPDSRTTIMTYLSRTPTFEGKAQLISGLLYFLKIWDFDIPFALFKEYREEIKKGTHGYFKILEDIIPNNFEWVFDEFSTWLAEDLGQEGFLRKPNTMESHYIKGLFGKMLENDLDKTLYCSIQIVETIMEKTGRQHFGNPILYDDMVFYDFTPNEHNYTYYPNEIYNTLVKAAEKIAIENPMAFRNFYNQFCNHNSKSVLKVLVFALMSQAQNYSAEIIKLINIFESKDGFSTDGTIHYWIRQMLNKSYALFDQQQKDYVNAIILSIDEYKPKIHKIGGTRQHTLGHYGHRKFKYLLALPKEEVYGQPEIKNKFQELNRKFNDSTVPERQPGKVLARAVPPPLPDSAYRNMSVENWEKTFVEFINNSRYSATESIHLHGDAFKKEVKSNPNKFYEFIKKMILEGKVLPNYWIYGLQGLAEGNFDLIKLLDLYHQAMLHKLDWLCFMDMLRVIQYFRDSDITSKEVITYLKKLSLGDNDMYAYLHEEEHISYTQESAVQKLMWYCHDPIYKDQILDTLRTVSNSSSIKVQKGIISNLDHLIGIEGKPSNELFLKIMRNATDEELLKNAMGPLHNNRDVDFKLALPLVKKWIDMAFLQEYLAGILAWNWIDGCKESEKLLAKISKHEAARVLLIRLVSENWFTIDEKGKKKLEILFLKFLDDDCKDVIHIYDVFFLHLKDRKDSFKEMHTNIKKYVKSNVCKKNPHYFMEYLTANASEYPIECLELIKHYKSFVKPNIQSGPYYNLEEPLKIVCIIYTALWKKKGFEKHVAKCISLFDEMLKTDHLRRKANEALVMIEK